MMPIIEACHSSLLEGIIVTFGGPERSCRAVSIGLPSIMRHMILSKRVKSARGINCPTPIIEFKLFDVWGIDFMSPREFIRTKVYLSGCRLCVKMGGGCSVPKQ